MRAASVATKEFVKMLNKLAEWWTLITNWLLDASAGNRLVLVGVVLATAWVANFVAKSLILRGLRTVVAKTRAEWDDQLVKHRVFEKLSHLAPALVIYGWASLLFPDDGSLEGHTQRAALAFMILVGGRVISSLLDAFLSIFRSIFSSIFRSILRSI